MWRNQPLGIWIDGMPISAEGTIGIALTLLGLAGTGAIMLAPTRLEIGWCLIAVAVVGGVGLVWSHFFGIRSGRMLPFIGMIAFGVGFLVCAAWYFWPANSGGMAEHKTVASEPIKIPILIEEFKQISAENELSARIGESIDKQPVKTISHAVSATHEKATIIWLRDLSTSYYIPSGMAEIDKSKKPIFVSDSDARNDEYKWNDTDSMRRLFAPPAGKLPPIGGVAMRWHVSKQKFGWIGWRLMDTMYDRGNLTYQRFKNGIIIGVVRTKEASDAGWIYVIIYGDSVAARATEAPVAPYLPTVPLGQ